jgi:O-antigen/teichoic acid export membrane protein
VWLTRNLSQADFGQYSLVLASLGVAALTAWPGMNPAVVKAAAEGKDKALWQSITLRMVFSLLGVVGLWLYWRQLPGWLLISLLISFPWLYSWDGWSHFLLGKQRFDQASLRLLVLTLVVAGGQALGVFGGWKMVVWLYLASTVGINLIFGGLTLSEYAGGKVDAGLTKYGGLLTLTNGLNFLSKQVDSLLVGLLAGPAALAVYAVGKKVPEMITMNMKGLLGIPVIRMITTSEQRSLGALRQHGLKLIGLGGLLALGSWLVYPWLFGWLYPDSYAQAVVIAQILSLSLIFYPFNVTVSGTLIYQKKQKQIAWLALFPAVPKLLLFLLLLPSLQIIGIAWAYVISEVLLTGYFVGYLKMHKSQLSM